MREVLCGIYLITNVKNGDQYVGQSVDILNRWNAHRNGIANRSHYNYRILDSCARYDESPFRFSVIELCPPRELDRLEFKWIGEFQPKLNLMTADEERAERLSIRRELRRSSQTSRFEDQSKMRRCQCGKMRHLKDRFCKQCSRQLIHKMKSSGYLEPIPKNSHAHEIVASRAVEMSWQPPAWALLVTSTLVTDI